MVLTFFYIQTILSAFIAFISFYRKSERNALIRSIGFLYMCSFAFNVAQYIAFNLREYAIMNIIGSVYEILYVITAGYIYNMAMKSRFKVLIATVSIIFLVGAVLNLTLFQTHAIATINRFTSNFIIMIYSVLYFYRLMVELPTIYIHRIPMFWISSAFLLFASGTIFLNAFMIYLINHNLNSFANYWVFNQSLHIIQQIIIIIGVSYSLRTFSSEKSQV